MYTLQHKHIWGQTLGFVKRKLLRGQTVAIIGYGSIGCYCANLAAAIALMKMIKLPH